jgi:hypothetical protein
MHMIHLGRSDKADTLSLVSAHQVGRPEDEHYPRRVQEEMEAVIVEDWSSKR